MLTGFLAKQAAGGLRVRRRRDRIAVRFLNLREGFREKRFAIKDLSLRVKSGYPQGSESLRHSESHSGRLFRTCTIKVRARTSAKPALPRGPNGSGESFGRGRLEQRWELGTQLSLGQSRRSPCPVFPLPRPAE